VISQKPSPDHFLEGQGRSREPRYCICARPAKRNGAIPRSRRPLPYLWRTPPGPQPARAAARYPEGTGDLGTPEQTELRERSNSVVETFFFDNLSFLQTQ
jgi:hypothetical protein